MTQSQTATHFAFVLEPGFTMQALSSAVEVLRVARKLGAETVTYSVSALGDTAPPASNGLTLNPTMPIAQIPTGAIIVVVSGAGANQSPNPPLVAKLRLWARQGRAIWGISSGVVRLAQAGLLDDGRTAAHWEDVPYLRHHHPRIEIATSLFILNARHPTCAGGGAAADLMMSHIRASAPPGLVEDIAARLMIDGVRDGRMRQNSPAQIRYTTSNKTVFTALRLMEAHCHDALPLGTLAAKVGVSQRQLERLFRAAFQKTPAAVYMAIRLEEARQEVLAGHRPILDIALDYGFRPAHFTKAYQRVFGALPSEERRGTAQ